MSVHYFKCCFCFIAADEQHCGVLEADGIISNYCFCYSDYCNAASVLKCGPPSIWIVIVSCVNMVLLRIWKYWQGQGHHNRLPAVIIWNSSMYRLLDTSPCGISSKAMPQDNWTIWTNNEVLFCFNDINGLIHLCQNRNSCWVDWLWLLISDDSIVLTSNEFMKEMPSLEVGKNTPGSLEGALIGTL